MVNEKSILLQNYGGEIMFFEYGNEEIFYSEYDAPVGKIEIGATESALVSLRFGESGRVSKFEPPISAEAYRQLSEYFEGQRKSFDLPLAPQGTDFQKEFGARFLKFRTAKREAIRRLQRRSEIRRRRGR